MNVDDRDFAVDLRPVRSIEREARNHYRQDRHAHNVFGTALLIGSGISQVIGNFFIGLNKRTQAPTKLFIEEQPARTWLESLRASEDRHDQAAPH